MLEQPVDEEFLKWEGSYPKGWTTIVEKCIKLVAASESIIRIDCIKEKFGSLRFYYTVIEERSEDPDQIFDIPLQEKITFLEGVCGHVCQECGTTLEVTTGPLDPLKRYGWIFTLCKRCRKFKFAEKS